TMTSCIGGFGIFCLFFTGCNSHLIHCHCKLFSTFHMNIESFVSQQDKVWNSCRISKMPVRRKIGPGENLDVVELLYICKKFSLFRLLYINKYTLVPSFYPVR